MSRLFAFVPAAQWGIDAPRETLIRFGHSKHGAEKFVGPLEPSPLLMCVAVEDGRESSYKLKQMLRGNEPYGEQCFNQHTTFRTTRAGDNYFCTFFTKQELFLLFETIARVFTGEAEPGETGETEPEGETVMRPMSSGQAAAVLCGVPGSIEAVLNN